MQSLKQLSEGGESLNTCQKKDKNGYASVRNGRGGTLIETRSAADMKGQPFSINSSQLKICMIEASS
jgi:hypothetical protein